MAPDKFEQYVKEKMRQREITPSDEAWNKIAGQLPDKEEKRKRPLVWYSIAASFVGILIITLYFTQSTKPVLESPEQIVATEENADETNVKDELPVIGTPEAEQPEILAVTPDLQEGSREEGLDPDKEMIPMPVEEELASMDVNSESEQNIPPGEMQLKEELIIQAKITEVVAEVRLLELNNDALTRMEVDSLLRKAQGELLQEQIFMEDRSVDAMALLNEVEDELDRSLRDQIFDRLKSGFNKVRTAVADRNN
ncbi:hypothetical protein LVD13_14530 [Flavobacteriaceae bacterium D16]|nr:hypothetical protein [Flavobacteriaceae bacterium D16]